SHAAPLLASPASRSYVRRARAEVHAGCDRARRSCDRLRSGPETAFWAGGDPPARLELEPIDAAVAQADAINVQRFGDDDVVGPARRKPSALREPGSAGESAALFVDGAADFNRAFEPDAGTLDGVRGEHRRSDSRLHVAGAASVNTAVANSGRKWI